MYEFIRRDGLEGFEKLPVLISEAYRMRRLAEQYDLTTSEGRTDYAKACAPYLRNLEPLDLENQLQQLMIQTGFSREVLLDQIGRTAPAKPAKAPGLSRRVEPIRAQVPEGERLDRLRAQETLISLIGTGHLPMSVAQAEDFDDPLLRSLYESLAEGTSAASLAEGIEDEADRARVTRLLQANTSATTDEMIRMAEECHKTLQISLLTEKLKAIQSQINQLTGEEKMTAVAEAMSLSQRLNELKA